jgi:hypothetical protein
LEANGRVNDLLQLAIKGDREATRYLLSLLTKNVEEFLNLCLRNPSLVREVWYPGCPFPLLHTHLRRNKEHYLVLPRDHVLRKVGVIPGRRSFSNEAVTTRVAIDLYYQMHFYRRMGPQGDGGEPLRRRVIKKAPGGKVDVIVRPSQTVSSAYHLGYLARDLSDAERIKRIRALAPLQPTNWREWWKEAESIFDNRYGPQFQDHLDFKAWRVKAYEGKQTKRGNPRKTAGAKRRDIKKAIRNAFKSLANITVPENPG